MEAAHRGNIFSLMSETITTTEERKTLEEILFAEPYRFDFFQAVRLLEKVYEDRRSVGQDTHAGNEIVRFRTPVNLAFPASQISALKREEETEYEPLAARMTVAFMGLTGPSGVLPHPYSELLMERLRIF
jgi:type VI secretion system protein ImpH